MKRKIFKFLVAATAVLSFVACDKEDGPVLTDNPTVPVISAPANNSAVTLDKANQETATIDFTWSSADYGLELSQDYVLKAAFNDTVVSFVTVNEANKVSLTHSALNKKLLACKVVGGTTVDVDFTITSVVSTNKGDAASVPVKVAVTTFSDKKSYDWIYAVGNFQGWKADAPTDSIKSEIGAKAYEGYVYMTTAVADIQGKLNERKAWTDGFCWGAGATAGSLSNDGGAGNLTFASPAVAGTYHIIANLNTLTWSSELYEVGIIGSATPTDWDSDTKLIYNNEMDVWELPSIALIGDKFIKFRLNSAWGTAWGGSLDNLSTTGGDIKIAASGTYSVTVDLKSTPMTCTLKLN